MTALYVLSVRGEYSVARKDMDMVADTTGLDGLIEILDLQISEKQAQVTAVLDEIVELKLRRERVAGALKEVVAVVVAPKHKVEQDTEQTAIAVPSSTSVLITDALRAAGKDGLSGGDLNKKVQEAGLSLAAADKAKARLKQAGAVTLEGGRWRLAPDKKKVA
jgi:hypothetical protein